MILATANHDKGNARAASGELAVVGMGMPARIASRDQFQFRRNPASVRRPLKFSSLLTRPRETGRGSPRSFSLIRIAVCSCMGITRRADTLAPSQRCRPDLIAAHGRHRRNVAPNRRSVAKFSAALLIGRSHQLYRISDKPGSDLAYPLHLRTSFVSSGCYVLRHSDGAITRVQEPFAFGANENE